MKPCPVCGLAGGFHGDRCHDYEVPRHLIKAKGWQLVVLSEAAVVALTGREESSDDLHAYGVLGPPRG